MDVPAKDVPAVDAPAVDEPAVEEPAVDVPEEAMAVDVPAVDVPEEDVPDEAMPEAAMPEVAMPEAAMPEAPLPEDKVIPARATDAMTRLKGRDAYQSFGPAGEFAIQGCFGTVYYAYEKKTGEVVAIKKEQFRTDAGAWSDEVPSLDLMTLFQVNPSANLVNLRWFWCEGQENAGNLYMVTDFYVPNLHHDWRFRGGLLPGGASAYSFQDAWGLAGDYFDGAAHLHMLDVIHTDVSFENLFITRNRRGVIGNLGRCKAGPQWAPSREPSGSPECRSPELHAWRDAVKIEVSSDVWSLSLVLAQLLTLTRFFISNFPGDDCGILNGERTFQAKLSAFGRPTEEIWPGSSGIQHWPSVAGAELEHVAARVLSPGAWINVSGLRRLPDEATVSLLDKLLAYDQAARPSSRAASGPRISGQPDTHTYMCVARTHTHTNSHTRTHTHICVSHTHTHQLTHTHIHTHTHTLTRSHPWT